MILEAMTYRIGPHSTSDDDSNYRHKQPPVEGFATVRARARARARARVKANPKPNPNPSPNPDPDPDSNPNPNRNPNANQERDYWEARSPIIRFGKYLEAKGWWSADEEAELRKSSRKRAIKSLNDAGKLPANHVKHLYTDVYDEQTWQQIEQKAELKAHLEKCALALSQPLTQTSPTFHANPSPNPSPSPSPNPDPNPNPNQVRRVLP